MNILQTSSKTQHANQKTSTSTHATLCIHKRTTQTHQQHPPSDLALPALSFTRTGAGAGSGAALRCSTGFTLRAVHRQTKWRRKKRRGVILSPNLEPSSGRQSSDGVECNLERRKKEKKKEEKRETRIKRAKHCERHDDSYRFPGISARRSRQTWPTPRGR
jgi:hypothetical protein